MIKIDVAIDVKPAVDRLNRIAKGIGDKALTAALNKTVAQARTQMIRGITAEYAIKAADVRERLQLRRASRQGMQFTATLLGNPAGRAKRAMNVIRVALTSPETDDVAAAQGQIADRGRADHRRPFDVPGAQGPAACSTLDHRALPAHFRPRMALLPEHGAMKSHGSFLVVAVAGTKGRRDSR